MSVIDGPRTYFCIQILLYLNVNIYSDKSCRPEISKFTFKHLYMCMQKNKIKVNNIPRKVTSHKDLLKENYKTLKKNHRSHINSKGY